MDTRTYTEGQSLVEVVIATAVILLLVTGVIIGTTASLKANQQARAKSMSTKLVQDVEETLRSKRDAGWIKFSSIAPGGVPVYYCAGPTFSADFDAGLMPVVDPMTGCSDNMEAEIATGVYLKYNRYIKAEQFADGIRVSVSVYWRENSAGYNRVSQATTDFTQWR